MSDKKTTPIIRKLSLRHYPLQFKNPIGTSRGVLQARDTWFIIGETDYHSIPSFPLLAGEAGYLPGLTLDHAEDYPTLIGKLNDLLLKKSDSSTFYDFYEWIHSPDVTELLQGYPALYFALETIEAVSSPYFLSSKASEPEPIQATLKNFFDGLIGIPMNGLVWMGSEDFQQTQMGNLLQSGFTTVKMKIGGLDFKQELALLENLCVSMEQLLTTTPQTSFTIRLDANGAFTPENAPKKLDALFQVAEKFPHLSSTHPLIHSIEQPLPALPHGANHMVNTYSKIFRESPIPIALDEELIRKPKAIPANDTQSKQDILAALRPHHLVLKPGVHGGFRECEEWISLAKKHGMGWWVTSALESNLGLTAIACWTARQMAKHYRGEGSSVLTHHDFNTLPPQGLGTGSLYLNNFWSPLKIKRGKLYFDRGGVNKLLKDVVLKTKG